MICKNCGRTISSQDTFCIYCGEKILEPRKRICPICFNELSNETSFCSECGYKFEPEDFKKSEVSIEDVKDIKTKNNNKLLIFLIVLIIALIVGICVALWMMISPSQNTESSKNLSAPIKKESFNKAVEDDDEEDNDDTASDDAITKDEAIEEDKSFPEYEIAKDDGEMTYEAPEFEWISASSELAPIDDLTYYVSNITDSDNDTAWIEGVSGDGIGEKITFSSDSEQKVSGIKIINGYCKSQDVYNKNNRVKELKISFSDGTEEFEVLPNEFGVITNIDFSEPKICSQITFTIESVYKGTKYEDTCISEISVY